MTGGMHRLGNLNHQWSSDSVRCRIRMGSLYGIGIGMSSGGLCTAVYLVFGKSLDDMRLPNTGSEGSMGPSRESISLSSGGGKAPKRSFWNCLVLSLSFLRSLMAAVGVGCNTAHRTAKCDMNPSESWSRKQAGFLGPRQLSNRNTSKVPSLGWGPCQQKHSSILESRPICMLHTPDSPYPQPVLDTGTRFCAAPSLHPIVGFSLLRGRQGTS